MPFGKLKLQPGVDIEASQTLNQTKFVLTNLCRFYDGLIQQIGGWLRLTSTTFGGICYGLHDWADIAGRGYLAVGTTTALHVYAYATSTLSVLTLGARPAYVPVVTNPAPSVSMIGGDTTVTIKDPDYTPLVGQVVTFNVQIAISGIVLYGAYTVTSTTPSSSTYTVISGVSALYTFPTGQTPYFAIASGGTTVEITFPNHGLITGGTFTVVVPVVGGGITLSGPYTVTVLTAGTFTIIAGATPTSSANLYENDGNMRLTYGVPPSTGSALPVALPEWALDNWGQDLIASPTNGPIYYWAPPTIGTANYLSYSAPIYNITVFVMPQIQIIVALGAEVLGQQQPLLVRWCDVSDFTDWTASATNQAGSFTIPTGTRLIAGLASGLGALLWTDVDLWSMTYQGFPFVFGFNRISANCGAISTRCVGLAGTLVMWPSLGGFFTYTIGGGVSPMECAVWDYFINNVDKTQFEKIHCAPNTQFHEFAWHFPVSGSSPLIANGPYSYVKFNYVEHVWDMGSSSQYQRTSWVNRSAIIPPIGADLSGLLQQHETSMDADGSPLSWEWQTGYFDIMDGQDYIFLDMIIPDYVTVGTPVIEHTLYIVNYPGQTPIAIGPQAWSPGTTILPLRVRGRQIAIGASGSTSGTFSRFGAFRYRFAPDGRD